VYYGVSEKTLNIITTATNNSNEHQENTSVSIENRGRVLGA